MVLFDANQFAYVDDGLEIGSSEVAAVEMLDNPTNNAATGTATSMASAFQVNMAVVRIIRNINWVKLRDDAAGVIELAFDVSPA